MIHWSKAFIASWECENANERAIYGKSVLEQTEHNQMGSRSIGIFELMIFMLYLDF